MVGGTEVRTTKYKKHIFIDFGRLGLGLGATESPRDAGLAAAEPPPQGGAAPAAPHVTQGHRYVTW